MQRIGVGSHNQAAQRGQGEAEATRQPGARCEGDPTPGLSVAAVGQVTGDSRLGRCEVFAPRSGRWWVLST
jgi:hypothetical protein